MISEHMAISHKQGVLFNGTPVYLITLNEVIWGINHPSKYQGGVSAECLDPACHCANGLVKNEYGQAGFEIF